MRSDSGKIYFIIAAFIAFVLWVKLTSKLSWTVTWFLYFTHGGIFFQCAIFSLEDKSGILLT